MEYGKAIVAIVEYEGKILVGKKIKKPGHPLSEHWHIPGGRVRDDETNEEAISRELKEEAGLDVKIIKFIEERQVEENKMIARWYLCRALHNDLKAGDDLSDVQFIERGEVRSLCSEIGVSLWPPKVVDYFSRESRIS